MPIRTRTHSLADVSLTIIATGVVMSALIWGSSFLMPLAIAILLWSLLEAVIGTLTGISFGGFHLPRLIAMIIAIGLVAFGFMVIYQIIASQGDAFIQEAPKYGQRLQDIFGSIGTWLGPEITNNIKTKLSEISFINAISRFAGSAQATLANAVLVMLYVGFMLAEGRHLTDKFSKLFSDKDNSSQVNGVLQSMSKNVSRYIWIKTIMSILTGGLSYVVLSYLGVDFPETWALIIFILNYIPTIGSILGVIFPAIIALIQFDTYTTFLIIALGLTAIQFFIGNVLEPMFMGNSLNLSPFAIILALTFWGSIWGPAGMFMSVPITVTMMIVASHMSTWRWLAVLLSQDGHVDNVI